MTKLQGSCLCGGVRYQINGPLTGALNCHCAMCRKAHGRLFEVGRGCAGFWIFARRGIGQILRIIPWNASRVLWCLRLSHIQQIR